MPPELRSQPIRDRPAHCMCRLCTNGRQETATAELNHGRTRPGARTTANHHVLRRSPTPRRGTGQIPRESDHAVADPLHSKMLDALRAVGFRLVAVDLRSVESGAFTVPLLSSDHD